MCQVDHSRVFFPPTQPTRICTGAGEYIVRATLARRISDALTADITEDVDVHAILQRVLADDFWSVLLRFDFEYNLTGERQYQAGVPRIRIQVLE